MQITLNVKDLNFDSALFFLRAFYIKLLEILEAFCGQGSHIVFRNKQLNGVYTLLKNFVEEILEREDFRELSKNAPQLFESLIGDIEEMDVEWEFLGKEAYEFLGKVEKQHILSGIPPAAMPKEFNEAFNEIDKAIVAHKEYARKKFAEMLEVAKKNKHLFEQGEKVKLSFKKIEFNDEKSTIKVDNKECPITPHTRKHMVCRVMFKHGVGEPVSWDEVYDEMMGEQAGKSERIVQDAMYGVNNDLKRCVNTDDDLFSWKNKNIIRNY